MTCPHCGKPVRDKREHRHRAQNDEYRRAEEYGRLVAQQERELLRAMIRKP